MTTQCARFVISGGSRRVLMGKSVPHSLSSTSSSSFLRTACRCAFATATNNNNYYYNYHNTRSFGTGETEKKKINSQREQVPAEDYYEGHLMADHLEYLDDMMEKTVKLESDMEELKDTYDQKYRLLFSSPDWMASSDIERLFHKSKAQKEEIKEQISELKELLADARKLIAVDSPDGISGAIEQEDMKAVEAIIDFAVTHENKEAIDKQHAKEERERQEALKFMAVDAPDGTVTEEQMDQDIDAVEEIIDFAKTHENKDAINRLHAQQERAQREALKIMAVDAPDGMPDALEKEQLDEVKHIIDDSSKAQGWNQNLGKKL